MEISNYDEVATPVTNLTEADDLCYRVSEVKLYKLTNSELEKYLGKLPDGKKCAKGDNITDDLDSDVQKSPPCTAYSRSGRPL